MDITFIEKARKRWFAYMCFALAMPVIIGFTVVDWLEGDTVETLINVLMVVVIIAGLVGIRKWDHDRWVYHFGLILLSFMFIYNVVIGSGRGTAIYWLFSFPLAFLFFLGKREGGTFAALFFILLSVILIYPLTWPVYRYDPGVSLRFLVSLLLVTLMAYGLEAARGKYVALISRQHSEPLTEKQHLERAMGEIKTLSGLIPICSHCKQIRDDSGFWQQVEVYVRDQSHAQFSHSICPACLKRFFPDLDFTVHGVDA